MFYLLHGDDEFTIREQVKKLRQQGNFEYNQDTYNGAEIDLASITATCDTLPFLADQRIVVVEGLPKSSLMEALRKHSVSSAEITSFLLPKAELVAERCDRFRCGAGRPCRC